MKAALSSLKRLFVGTSLLVLLFLIPALVACSTVNSNSNATPTSTVKVSITPISTASAGTPVVLLGVKPCPGDTGKPAHWQAIINPYAYGGQQHVESVSCANIMGAPSLQALVTDRRSDAGATLDVFVFNNITQATPTKVFQLMGLVKGDAKMSGYNTVMTAQADQLSALNAGKPVSAMTADLFREFKWAASAGTLAQTVFPGIFPDLTRYQAEADQAQVNSGHQPWKLSATMVANALAVSLLSWSPSSSTILLSGGGTHDTDAVVKVRNSTVVSGSIIRKVQLALVDGNEHAPQDRRPERRADLLEGLHHRGSHPAALLR